MLYDPLPSFCIPWDGCTPLQSQHPWLWAGDTWRFGRRRDLEVEVNEFRLFSQMAEILQQRLDLQK